MKKLSFADLENTKYYWMHNFDETKSIWRVVQAVKLIVPMPYYNMHSAYLKINTPYIQWIGSSDVYDESYFSKWINVFFVELENPWSLPNTTEESII